MFNGMKPPGMGNPSILSQGNPGTGGMRPRPMQPNGGPNGMQMRPVPMPRGNAYGFNRNRQMMPGMQPQAPQTGGELPPYNGMQQFPSQAPVSGGPTPGWQDPGFSGNGPQLQPGMFNNGQTPDLSSFQQGGISNGPAMMPGGQPQNIQAFLDYLRQHYAGALGGANG